MGIATPLDPGGSLRPRTTLGIGAASMIRLSVVYVRILNMYVHGNRMQLALIGHGVPFPSLSG